MAWTVRGCLKSETRKAKSLLSDQIYLVVVNRKSLIVNSESIRATVALRLHLALVAGRYRDSIHDLRSTIYEVMSELNVKFGENQRSIPAPATVADAIKAFDREC